MSDVFARSTLRIQTPEGVSFALPLAGANARFLALAIDLCAMMAAVSVIGNIIGPLMVLAPDMMMALYILSYFAINVLYGIVFEFLWNGQTPGKRVMGIRVADIHGLRLSFSQIVLRNLLRWVDSLPAFYLLGGAIVLISPYMQRLGDIAGNTVVISSRQPRRPAIDQLGDVRYNSLREYPWIEARLRQRTTPEEAALLVQSLLRREQLEPNDRVAVFAELAEHFKKKTKLPEAATLGVTDEQFLRNLVDSLYRDSRPA